MIVKGGDSRQLSFLKEYKPLYVNCKTCARLVPDGICIRCNEEIHTNTPWYRMSQFKTPKTRNMSISRKAAKILEAYKLR